MALQNATIIIFKNKDFNYQLNVTILYDIYQLKYKPSVSRKSRLLRGKSDMWELPLVTG